jgi:hypothetical protein
MLFQLTIKDASGRDDRYLPGSWRVECSLAELPAHVGRLEQSESVLVQEVIDEDSGRKVRKTATGAELV